MKKDKDLTKEIRAPRELTTDEVRELFMEKVRETIDYWRKTPDVAPDDRISGAVFSVLVLLDGGTMELPELIAPNPHPSDANYLLGNGEDWFPENFDISIKGNIGGYLHEVLNK